jgi:hypothetical protein
MDGAGTSHSEAIAALAFHGRAAHLEYGARRGAQRVRVLFIGSDSIMTRIIGEPYTDYDAHLIPNRNNWIKPNEFAEAGELTPPPALEAAYHQQV